MTPSEREKYEICYQLPNYRLQGARLAKVMKDVEAIPPGATYLDVGCGRGEMVQLARSRGVDAKGVELVAYLCDGQNVINAEITALPFDDGDFDVVSCYDVVEHLPEDQVDLALDELFRVARQTVLITTNDKRSTYNGMELHLTRKPRDWWDAKLSARAASLERSSYGQDEWHWRCEVPER